MNPSSQKILLCDDDANLLEGLKRQLRHRFDIRTATNGREGLQILLEEGPLAVVVSDFKMPGMSGAEFLRRIHQLAPDTVRVMLTQYADVEVAVAAIHEGRVFRFLEKPCPPALLVATLQDCLEHYRLICGERQLIEELNRANEELKAANASMAAARTEAENANRAKGAFLAYVSHEVRTPLGVIRGYADTLEDPELAESEKRNAVQSIGRTADHLLHVVSDLLDLSKIEEGRLVVDRLACSPTEILTEICSLLQGRVDAKGLALSVEYVSPVPEYIVTDPVRLRQILMNLADNAIKYTERGRIRIVARMVDGGSRLNQMQFEVIDTGIGISSEGAARLFQAYSRGDASTARRFGGTGLGLTISKRLAELLGGSITFDSRPGRGSTFRVTVDAGPVEEVLRGETPSDAILEEPGPQVAGDPEAGLLGCHVLLAEDDPDNQRLISRLLKRDGAAVTIVGDGKQAAEAAAASTAGSPPFDIILMDSQMPVMDGYTATRRLRAAGYRGVILALTANQGEEERRKCTAAGCSGVLSKPVNRRQLLSVIREYLDSETAGLAASAGAYPVNQRDTAL